MKLYRMILVILLVVAVGCGAWYFYGVFQNSDPTEDGTLVKKCEQLCPGLQS
jgi:hypothetical protein